jgi:hypothetical protein
VVIDGKDPRDKVVSCWRGLSDVRHICMEISLDVDGKKRRGILDMGHHINGREASKVKSSVVMNGG